MGDVTPEMTIAQLRRVAKWWAGDAQAEQSQMERDGDWHAQAARASRRQADDWYALGDLLQYAAAHVLDQHGVVGVQHFVLAAERLADRLDPDWRRFGAGSDAEQGNEEVTAGASGD